MFDGNGNWTSDFSAQADRDNGIKILASRFDNIFIADIKESFENCLTKDGQITPIGNFNMGGQRIVNLDDGINAKDAVNMEQLDTTVKLTGDQTIDDTKTFSESPIIPTPDEGDNSTKAATTAFVQSEIYKQCVPDYANQSSVSGSSFTATADGWVSIKVGLGNNGSCSMKINDKEVWYQTIGGDRSAGGTFSSGLYKIYSGYVITTTASSTIYFYPEL